MNIKRYDKLLRLQHLRTAMPPLRLTRLSPADVADHMRLIGLKYGNVYKKLRTRFCDEFGNFN